MILNFPYKIVFICIIFIFSLNSCSYESILLKSIVDSTYNKEIKSIYLIFNNNDLNNDIYDDSISTSFINKMTSDFEKYGIRIKCFCVVNNTNDYIQIKINKEIEIFNPDIVLEIFEVKREYNGNDISEIIFQCSIKDIPTNKNIYKSRIQPSSNFILMNNVAKSFSDVLINDLINKKLIKPIK